MHNNHAYTIIISVGDFLHGRAMLVPLSGGNHIMMLDMTYENGVLTAKLSGEIDHHAAPQIRADIDARCERCRPARLVLDFGGVTFMDSSGIGLIMGRYRTVSLIGGRLEVVNIPPQLKKIFVISGIETLGVMK